MSLHPYLGDLSNWQWNKVAHLLPPEKPGGRPRKWQTRKLTDGIRFVLATGCPWREVPRSYAPWNTVYSYYRKWLADGTWERVEQMLNEQLRGEERTAPNIPRFREPYLDNLPKSLAWK